MVRSHCIVGRTIFELVQINSAEYFHKDGVHGAGSAFLRTEWFPVACFLIAYMQRGGRERVEILSAEKNVKFRRISSSGSHHHILQVC